MAETAESVPGELIAELLAGGADGFVARRSALVKRLKSEDQRVLADQVSRLRKPVRAVWQLLELGRQSPGAVERLDEVARAARTAQSVGRGTELREATAAMRGAIHEIASNDPDAAADLRVVAADQAAMQALRGGYLLALPQGDGLTSFREQTVSIAQHGATDGAAAEPSSLESGPDPAELRRAEAEVGAAENELQRAEQNLATAREWLADAQRVLGEREQQRAEAAEAAKRARRRIAELTKNASRADG